MTRDTVSVIVPAYNAAEFLSACLDSLLAQTWEDLEVVVVNDGSTDDTAQKLEAYAQKHPRVRAVNQENRGVTAARLRGVAEAGGDWIGFVDADDVVEPDMYRRLMENARTYGCDISHCGHRIVFPDGRIAYVHNTGVLRRQDTLTGQRDLLDAGQIDASLCTKLFRRTLFQGIGEWMEPGITNNEDFLMNFYLFSRSGGSVYEDVCPYHYLLRRGSASYRTFHEHSLFDPIRVRQLVADRCAPELRRDARNALLRNLLFIYARLAVETGENRKAYRRRVRQLLRENRPYYDVLSPRNRLLANMICYAPWSFRAAYQLYVALFQRQEQH